MKYCKDCKHFNAAVYRCSKFSALEVNPIFGATKTDFKGWESSCRLQRADGWFMARLLGTCGKEARFFEPIE